MHEILQKIINELSTNELEEIFIINKLTIQGFRIDGPSNPIKTKKMKTLLCSSPRLERYIKKTADYYKEKRNSDFTWALLTNLSVEDVQQKLKELKLSEVIYALAYENKLNLLESIYSEHNKPEELISKVPNETDSTEPYETTITNLRELITRSEAKYNTLSEKFMESREEINILKKEKEDLLNQIQAKNKDIQKSKKDYNDLLTIYTKEKNRLNSYIEKENTLLKENKQLSKIVLENEHLRLLVFSTIKAYHQYIKRNTATIKKIEIDYVSDTTELNEYKNKQKLIVLKFSLNQSEKLKFQATEAYSYFKDLYNLVIIETIEELDEYIERVRLNYE